MTQTNQPSIMNQLECVHATGRKITRFGETPKFSEGLYKITDDVYVWLVPNGSWGESNAGVIVGNTSSALVDTLWDLVYTNEMLSAMKPFVTHRPIRTVINTHADGDHFWGNQLFTDAEIIASKKGNEEMSRLKPQSVIMLALLGKILNKMPNSNLKQAGHFFKTMVSPYHFRGIRSTPATRTFEGALSLDLDGKKIDLIEVGPAHTPGDILVYAEASKTIFTGDILFMESTPVMWAGPLKNWINALDRILEMDVDYVVPGHGPVTDKEGVKQVKAYWAFVSEELGKCFKKGWKPEKAATAIALSQNFASTDFYTWNSPERLMVNAHSYYREFKGKTGGHPGVPEIMKIMRKQAILANKLPQAQPRIMRRI